MALTEIRNLVSVSHNLAANTLDVKWEDVILRDGVPVTSTPFRRAYGIENKDQFILDLGPDAAKYLAAAGW